MAGSWVPNRERRGREWQLIGCQTERGDRPGELVLRRPAGVAGRVKLVWYNIVVVLNSVQVPYLSVQNLVHPNNLLQFVKLCFVLPSPRLPTSRHRSSPFVTCRADIIMVSHPNETPDCLRSIRFRWLLFLLPFEFAVKKRARPAPTLLVHRAA